MYNDDYIIAIDENGQPYIAHAFGDGYRRAKAKYLEKVRTKSGAWRYLYTPEEVKAYILEKLKAAGCHQEVFEKNAVEAITGASNGTPRMIDKIVNSSLMIGCSLNQNIIVEDIYD